MFGQLIGKCKRLARYARHASLCARGVVYCGNGCSLRMSGAVSLMFVLTQKTVSKNTL